MCENRRLQKTSWETHELQYWPIETERCLYGCCARLCLTNAVLDGIQNGSCKQHAMLTLRLIAVSAWVGQLALLRDLALALGLRRSIAYQMAQYISGKC